jgi:DNA polymerase
MRVAVVLPGPADFEAWRRIARGLRAADLPPEQVAWHLAGEGPGLFAGDPPPPARATQFAVPRAFMALAETVIRHHHPERFALLYALLWRVTGDAPALLDNPAEPLVARARAMAAAVRRDAHKMHAFLRFRAVETPDGVRHIAWFEPDHHIERAEAGFFVRRFAQLRWTIVTPRVTLVWDGRTVQAGPGGRKADLPPEDAMEPLWRAYYVAICNPARLKPGAMRAEMPRKYWRNLPETAEIPRLMAEAPARVRRMAEEAGAAPRHTPQRRPPERPLAEEPPPEA